MNATYEQPMDELRRQRDEARAEVERLRAGWDRDVEWANKLLVELHETRAEVARLHDEVWRREAALQRLRGGMRQAMFQAWSEGYVAYADEAASYDPESDEVLRPAINPYAALDGESDG